MRGRRDCAVVVRSAFSETGLKKVKVIINLHPKPKPNCKNVIPVNKL